MQQREIVNYALGGERCNVLPAVLGAARPRGELGAGAGLADRHHRAQEGRGLPRVPRQARRADQAAQPRVFEDELVRLERHGPWPVTRAGGRPERTEARQRRGRPRRRRRAAAPRRRGAGKAVGEGDQRRAHRRRRVRAPAARHGRRAARAQLAGAPRDAGRAQQPVLPGPALALAIGSATAGAGERLESAVSEADRRMYDAKKACYASAARDRRK